MEFLDEEARPKFQFQSRVSSSASLEPDTQIINKPIAISCAAFSILLLLLTIFFFQSEIPRFILIWFAVSFLIGPFAPLSITAGDIRVGQGEVLEPPPDLDLTAQTDEQYKKRQPNRRNKSRRQDEPVQSPIDSNSTVAEEKSVNERVGLVQNGENGKKDTILEEKEWTDGDFDLLKKLITKHPVGTPRRWELIAEAFKGRHGVDSVIKTAKSMGERKPGSGDSFSQFLKQRKPLDKRMEEGDGDLVENGEVKKESSGGAGLSWSSAEDIALLNALKVFPKDVAMRWEKIAVAVPGRSKVSCMKRVAELKKGFRSTKASAE